MGKDVCIRKKNPNLFTVLVNLSGNEIEYYIYEYDVLSERVESAYAEYIEKPKRDGGERKDIDFRWWDLKKFKDDDLRRKNNWELLGF